jgi:hypothetical protein
MLPASFGMMGVYNFYVIKYACYYILSDCLFPTLSRLYICLLDFLLRCKKLKWLIYLVFILYSMRWGPDLASY